MSRYGKLNLVPAGEFTIETGIVKYDRVGISILRGSEVQSSWIERAAGDPWLILHSGSAWPVMLRLDERDIERLYAQVKKVR